MVITHVTGHKAFLSTLFSELLFYDEDSHNVNVICKVMYVMLLFGKICQRTDGMWTFQTV